MSFDRGTSLMVVLWWSSPVTNAGRSPQSRREGVVVLLFFFTLTLLSPYFNLTSAAACAQRAQGASLVELRGGVGKRK